ncbi:alpha/beta hydrolase [Ornithinicoccus hortensis]|uniref:S-formylglutathione hydrolase FrmB n=1 Tax=Ornithinicoccus hortensis TaxID=82346 RepID=A0A542YNA5_9MICO|nr:alpha/beta hydrolase-fold protein [Ornithinicoccus hortensis]TQL49519.1 S-formylglutathione hydrolase FrmB [Ornithinicoccus hortensis]
MPVDLAVSRRTVLRGGLLTLAGAAGVSSLSGCGTPESGLPVQEGRLDTDHWPGQTPRWRLAVPEQATATVIALHGYGGDSDFFFDPPLAAQVAEQHGIAVAAVDGGDTYWHARADGTDTGAMVLEDLLPALEEAGAPVDRVGLTGFSMGGYGALLLATQLPPARVLGVAAVSAAIFFSIGESTGSFDDEADFAEHDLFRRVDALRQVPVWLACGASDSFAETNQALADELPDAVAVLDAGEHDRVYFEGHWPEGMAFLGELAQG